MVIGEVRKSKTRSNATMNQEHSANYEDRIEFIIALMTKDYAKAVDVGNRLLKQNRNDVDVISALNILKHRSRREPKEYERSSLIESDCECEGSDTVDGHNTDFVDGDADIHIDPGVASKIASYDTSRLNNDEAKTRLDFKQKMHRVISIKMNKKVTQTKDLTNR